MKNRPILTEKDGEFARVALQLQYINKRKLRNALAMQQKFLGKGKYITIAECLLRAGYLQDEQIYLVDQHCRSQDTQFIEDHGSTQILDLPQIDHGQKFGRFTISEQIGEGGMGRVYKAHDPKLNRTIALKLLICGHSEKAIQRFLREAEITSQLRHPNIVTLYDIGEQDGQPFFTMEFIEGNSLERLLETTSFSQRKVLTIINKVGQALHYAHRQGIIHRDLKPANIMIDADGEPKIMDFGLAKMQETNTKITESGARLGTPYYMSPEQAKGKPQDVDVRSDVHSLGVILYEMLTGRQAFYSKYSIDILHKIIYEAPIPPSKYNDRIPKHVETACLHALEKNKELRPASVEIFLQELNDPQSHKKRRFTSLLLWRRLAVSLLIFCLGSATGIFAPRYVELFFPNHRENKQKNSALDVDELFRYIKKQSSKRAYHEIDKRLAPLWQDQKVSSSNLRLLLRKIDSYWRLPGRKREIIEYYGAYSIRIHKILVERELQQSGSMQWSDRQPPEEIYNNLYQQGKSYVEQFLRSEESLIRSQNSPLQTIMWAYLLVRWSRLALPEKKQEAEECWRQVQFRLCRQISQTLDEYENKRDNQHDAVLSRLLLLVNQYAISSLNSDENIARLYERIAARDPLLLFASSPRSPKEPGDTAVILAYIISSTRLVHRLAESIKKIADHRITAPMLLGLWPWLQTTNETAIQVLSNYPNWQHKKFILFATDGVWSPTDTNKNLQEALASGIHLIAEQPKIVVNEKSADDCRKWLTLCNQWLENSLSVPATTLSTRELRDAYIDIIDKKIERDYRAILHLRAYLAKM